MRLFWVVDQVCSDVSEVFVGCLKNRDQRLLRFFSTSVVTTYGVLGCDHRKRAVSVAKVLYTDVADAAFPYVPQSRIDHAQSKKLQKRATMNQASLDSRVGECV